MHITDRKRNRMREYFIILNEVDPIFKKCHISELFYNIENTKHFLSSNTTMILYCIKGACFSAEPA